MCKTDITKIEDQEIELMEQGEQAQKDVVRLRCEAEEARKLAEDQVKQLGVREGNLKKELAELQSNREQLANSGCDPRGLRWLSHETARAGIGELSGAAGACDLHQLRPDPLLHARHGAGWRRIAVGQLPVSAAGFSRAVFRISQTRVLPFFPLTGLRALDTG